MRQHAGKRGGVARILTTRGLAVQSDAPMFSGMTPENRPSRRLAYKAVPVWTGGTFSSGRQGRLSMTRP